VVDHGSQVELPWGEMEKAFYAFCKGDSYLDGREFVQLCMDCQLYVPKKFTSADADVIFSRVKNRGERKLGSDQFRDALIGIAGKRESTVADVQRAVTHASGPAMHGITKADNVRFHDDKSSYTGMHANNDFHAL